MSNSSCPCNKAPNPCLACRVVAKTESGTPPRMTVTSGYAVTLTKWERDVQGANNVPYVAIVFETEADAQRSFLEHAKVCVLATVNIVAMRLLIVGDNVIPLHPGCNYNKTLEFKLSVLNRQ